jgi:Actinobacteria/chloroflexi VLRF1 release factor
MPESAEEGPAAERVVTVAPERLGRWLTGFTERHGAISVAADSHHVTVSGPDGARAIIAVTFPPLPSTSDPINAVLDHVSRERRVGALLVRKGGYAVGVFGGRTLITSKVGSAYVQGKTKAGGWSQQRFARRRSNQADALADAVAGHALRLLLHGNESPAPGAAKVPAGLVVGGDRTLVGHVLADPRLRSLADLPRRALYDVPDPRRDVLDRALERGRAVHIHLTEPAP